MGLNHCRVRPATAAEIAALLPYLGYMSRETMLPSIWVVASSAPDISLAVFALHVNNRSAYLGCVYNFAFFPLPQALRYSLVDDCLACALAYCHEQLAADCLVTPFVQEDDRLFDVLQTAGFAISQSAYEKAAIDPRQIAAAFEAGKDLVAQWVKVERIDLVPYAQGPEEAARQLHLEALGVVPDGHYAIHRMLDSDKDYTGACMAMKAGQVLGHVMVSHKPPEAICESIVVCEAYQGTPLVAHLCASVIASVVGVVYDRVMFSVNTRNERSLGFTGAFDCVTTGMRHQLVLELSS